MRPQGEGHSAGLMAAWSMLFLLLLLNMAAMLDRQIISLLVDPIKADIGINDTQISLLQGFAFALLYCTCALPIGYAVDRYSRRMVIFLGVLIWSIAASACGLVSGFAGLLIARVFVGMGEAALAPASFSILSDMFEKRRLSSVLGIYSMGSALGVMGSLLIGSLLVEQFGSGMELPIVGELRPWQAVLFLSGLPGLVLCGTIFLLPEPSRGGEARSAVGSDMGWKPVFALLANRRGFFTCHFVGFALLMALTYAHLSWTPAILVRVYGWKVAEIGIIYGILIGATAIGGLLLNGGITDRLFSRGASDAHLRYYATASLILAAFGGATSLAPTGSLFLLLLIPVLLLTSLGGVAAAAVQIVTPPTLRGRVSALYLMIVSMFGLVVGPSSVAILSDYVVGTDNIGLAFSLAYLVLAPIAAAFLFRGMKHMRMALTEDHGPSTVMDMPTLPSGHRAA